MINSRSIIFLLILFSLFLFLAGFRLGKKIERIDKTLIPLLTPTATPKPTATPRPLRFNTFLSADCGLKFLYPDFFEEKEVATDEGRLIYNNDEIKIDCRQSKIEEFTKNIKSYQKDDGLIIKNQKVQVYQVDERLSFLITHPPTAKKILIILPKNLLNLVSETLEFL